MNRLKVSSYAKQMGLSVQTVRNMYHAGKIPGMQLESGTILLDDPSEALRPDRGAALYARVSSSQNKDNLISQMKRLEDYASARGYRVEHSVSEVGSGLNDSRKKFLTLLDKEWDVLVVEHKDRLTRFGFTYLEKVAELKGARIEVINSSTDDDDLMQDFVSVITSFCARLYGQRRGKRKTEKIIEELNHAGDENPQVLSE